MLITGGSLPMVGGPAFIDSDDTHVFIQMGRNVPLLVGESGFVEGGSLSQNYTLIDGWRYHSVICNKSVIGNPIYC